jgi:hypothetical protein
MKSEVEKVSLMITLQTPYGLAEIPSRYHNWDAELKKCTSAGVEYLLSNTYVSIGTAQRGLAQLKKYLIADGYQE